MQSSTRVSSVDDLSLREFGVIVFPGQSRVYELEQSAFSDSDVVFKLHLGGPVRWACAVSPAFSMPVVSPDRRGRSGC